MKPPIILTAGQTRLNALESRFDSINFFRLSRYGTEWDEPDPTFVLDATFDIYDPKLMAEDLYGHFAEAQKTLRSLDKLDKQFYVVRDYPLSSNERRLNLLSYIVERFVETAVSFHDAKLIYAPLVVSRYSTSRLNDPVSAIIQAVRLGKSIRVPFQESSRLPVLYDQDFLSALIEACESFDGRNRVIEANDMTLAAVSQIAQSIAGEIPVQFDRKDFVHYRYPDDPAPAVGQVNYQLENMMIDLIDRLF